MLFRSHRLVSKAYEMGGSAVQIALITEIFRAYCEDDLDISDARVLADVAEESGMMSKAEVSVSPARRWLLTSIPFHVLRRGAVFQSNIAELYF